MLDDEAALLGMHDEPLDHARRQQPLHDFIRQSGPHIRQSWPYIRQSGPHVRQSGHDEPLDHARRQQPHRGKKSIYKTKKRFYNTFSGL